MKRIPTFVAGMLTAAVIGGLGVGALAASGAVSFNATNIQLNGQQISAKGENYTLPSGQQVPASITYTDETGGGTTYLPVRRIAELLGVEIGWDSATGSVTVAGEANPNGTTHTPDTTVPSTDYSDWSAEEEAAYQEFKEECKVKALSGNELEKLYGRSVKAYSGIELKLSDTTQYDVDYQRNLQETTGLNIQERVAYWNQNIKDIQLKFAKRFTEELSIENPVENTVIVFHWNGLTVMVTVMHGASEYAEEIRV